MICSHLEVPQYALYTARVARDSRSILAVLLAVRDIVLYS